MKYIIPYLFEETKLSCLTNGKQLYSGISETLGRRLHIILWFPIGDQDADFGNARPGAWLWLETVLQHVRQCKAWKCTHSLAILGHVLQVMWFKTNDECKMGKIHFSQSHKRPLGIFKGQDICITD